MESFHESQKEDSSPDNWRELDVLGGFNNGSDKYPSNKQSSSRFTILNIVPKSIYEELQKISNLWFLFIIIIAFIDPMNSLWHRLSRLLPLIFILCINLSKDISTFVHQYTSDNKLNNKVYLVWTGQEFEERLGMDILVSDILLIMDKDIIPADSLLFYVENQRECFADTFAVLGERNLQVKKPIKDIQTSLNGGDLGEVIGNLKRLKGTVLVKNHIKNDDYIGKIKLRLSPKAMKITKHNLLLRGTIVCNTPWLLAYVITTGKDSSFTVKNKINQTSQIDKKLELWNITIILAIVLITLVNFFISIPVYKLEYPGYMLFNFLKESQDLVPISLYLVIHLIRIVRAVQINKRTAGVEVKNPVCLEDLGQVDYIVANKTGTVTRNELSTQVCIIVDKAYWRNPPAHAEENMDFRYSPGLNNGFESQILTFRDLRNEIESGSRLHYHFLLCMAICNHTTTKGMGEEYFSLSGDDKVLVETALMLGMRLLTRSSNSCTLNFDSHELEYAIVGYQHFSSDSKKCRVVIQDLRELHGYLYVKGSKEDMLDIFHLSYEEKTSIEEFTLSKNLIRMRTVLMGFKKLSNKELEEFDFAYQTAASSPINSNGRIDAVFEALEKDCDYLGIAAIEDIVDNETRECLTCLSQAGVKVWVTSGDDEESALTAGVSSHLFEENVRIVRLANFTSETESKNIMAQQIKEHIFHEHAQRRDSSNSILSDFDDRSLEHQAKSEPMIFLGIRSLSLQGQIKKAERSGGSVSPREAQTLMTKNDTAESSNAPFNPNSVYFVLSVDSSGLEYGLKTEGSRKLFISLLFAAHSVIFHSLQSDQKTNVIKILKQNFRFEPVVLAISDGKCDSGMLQEAHIGVNIDKPNSHLWNLADFSLSHFSQLKYMLISLGHWSCINLATIIMYSIYSKVLLATVLVIFNTMSEFSASVLLDDELIVIYWIILPIIQMVFVGIYDMDLTESQLKNYPQVYSLGVHKEIIVRSKLLINVVEGLVHGFIVCFFYYLAAHHAVSLEGRPVGMEEISFIINLSMFIICTVRLILETHSLSIFTLLGHFLAFGILIIHVICRNYILGPWFGFFEMHQHTPTMFLTFFLLPSIIFVLQASVKFGKSLFWPDILQYINSIQAKEVTFDLISRLTLFKDQLSKVYKRSKEWNSKNSSDSLEFNKKTLRFCSDQKEADYSSGKFLENVRTYRVLLITCCVWIGLLIACIVNIEEEQAEGSLPALVSLVSVFIGMVSYSYSGNFKRHFKSFIALYYFVILIFLIIASQIYSFSMIQVNSVLLLIFFIAFNSDWLYNLLLSFISAILSCIISSQYYIDQPFPAELTILFMISFLALLMNSALVSYSIDRTKRQEYILIHKVEIEVDKSKSVLSYLLPAFVRKRVKDGVRYISENQGTVSVFFCDIMDFEEIVAAFTPIELTAFLDDVFGKFDQICRVVGVTKIETVGKTYMACAGLKDSEEEMDPYYGTVPHSRRAVEMGLAVIGIVNSISVRRGLTLSVKIGVNSGAVTAGVIGYHKPQFSLVGDTVNTASRMASTCPSANMLQISKNTYDLLEDKRGLVFTSRRVEVKGKGPMDTFLVRVPIGITENAIYDLQSMQLTSRISHSPNAPATRSVSMYPRNGFAETSTVHERRLSALLTHLEISDAVQLFQRTDTELIEEVKWFSVSCTEMVKEKRFRLETVENNRPVIMIALIVIIVSNVLSILVYVISAANHRFQAYYFIGKLAVEITLEAILLVGLKKYLKELWFAWSLQLVYVIAAVVEIAMSITEPREISIVFISILNHVFLFSHCAELFFKHNFWSLLLVTVLWLALIEATNPVSSLITSLLTLVTSCTLIFTVYTSERNLRISSTLKAAANKELDKTEKLIKQMMPPHVVQNLKEQSSITDKITQVTILYADIVGFTAWSSSRSPEEIVNMLSELFTMFDKKCVDHAIYKVHTIGDCYVAMGYTGQAIRDSVKECLNVVEFARETLEIIQNVNIENDISLNMRIGIHTGDVTAGVTGTNVVRYDIYGSDVMIANKIESCGIPGRILVSEATKRIIENTNIENFSFTPHVDFFVKSTKKNIKTFLLED